MRIYEIQALLLLILMTNLTHVHRQRLASHHATGPLLVARCSRDTFFASHLLLRYGSLITAESYHTQMLCFKDAFVRDAGEQNLVVPSVRWQQWSVSVDAPVGLRHLRYTRTHRGEVHSRIYKLTPLTIVLTWGR